MLVPTTSNESLVAFSLLAGFALLFWVVGQATRLRLPARLLSYPGMAVYVESSQNHWGRLQGINVLMCSGAGLQSQVYVQVDPISLPSRDTARFRTMGSAINIPNSDRLLADINVLRGASINVYTADAGMKSPTLRRTRSKSKKRKKNGKK